MHDFDQINKILNDAWTFNLALFSVSITLFTVLYSFILNKRDELSAIAEQIKLGDKSLMLSKREAFAYRYVSQLKVVNGHLAFIVIASFIAFLFGWMSERIITDENVFVKQITFYITTVLTVSLILYSAVLFYRIYRYYLHTTKI